jgi:hypothetical protein
LLFDRAPLALLLVLGSACASLQNVQRSVAAPPRSSAASVARARFDSIAANGTAADLSTLFALNGSFVGESRDSAVSPSGIAAALRARQGSAKRLRVLIVRKDAERCTDGEIDDGMITLQTESASGVRAVFSGNYTARWRTQSDGSVALSTLRLTADGAPTADAAALGCTLAWKEAFAEHRTEFVLSTMPSMINFNTRNSLSSARPAGYSDYISQTNYHKWYTSTPSTAYTGISARLRTGNHWYAEAGLQLGSTEGDYFAATASPAPAGAQSYQWWTQREKYLLVGLEARHARVGIGATMISTDWRAADERDFNIVRDEFSSSSLLPTVAVSYQIPLGRWFFVEAAGRFRQGGKTLLHPYGGYPAVSADQGGSVLLLSVGIAK